MMERTSLRRARLTLLVWTALASAWAIACGSSGRGDAAPGDADTGRPTPDGSAGIGPGVGGDGGACTNHEPQCPCPTSGATVACWTGPAADRGVGACKDGTQTCEQHGEFLAWSPCVGEVLTCGGGDAASAEGPLLGQCGLLAIAEYECILTAKRGVRCIGSTFLAEEGGITTQAADVPGLSDVRCIGGGETSLCALSRAGSVSCFDQADPTNTVYPVPGLESGVVTLAVGEYHACVLMGAGEVKCWALGGMSSEIEPQITFPSTPTAVTGLAPGVVDIASGDGFSCALLGSGTVQCWGGNNYGELGNGTSVDSMTPVGVVGLPSPAVAVYANAASDACALLTSGQVFCWGLRVDADADAEESSYHAVPTPVEVKGFAAEVTAVTTGGEWGTSCALLKTGGVQCWGYGYRGNGQGSPSPEDVGISSGAVEIRSNDSVYCARMADGRVLCWGAGSFAMDIGLQ